MSKACHFCGATEGLIPVEDLTTDRTTFHDQPIPTDQPVYFCEECAGS